MPQRNYHEKKALRCMQSIITMKKKLERLEGVQVKKIENIKEEIEAIRSSTVTLRCIDCNYEFPILFDTFAGGEYPLFCPACRKKENIVYLTKVREILDKFDINYYCTRNRLEIVVPNKGV